jgi:hypothetical protein
MCRSPASPASAATVTGRRRLGRLLVLPADRTPSTRARRSRTYLIAARECVEAAPDPPFGAARKPPFVTRGGTHNWLIWAWPHCLVLPMPVGRIRPGELSTVSPNTCRNCPVLRLPAWSRRDGMFHGREKFGLASRAEYARCAPVSGSRCRLRPAQSTDDRPPVSEVFALRRRVGSRCWVLPGAGMKPG